MRLPRELLGGLNLDMTMSFPMHKSSSVKREHLPVTFHKTRLVTQPGVILQRASALAGTSRSGVAFERVIANTFD
jgi:hypothetical protein